MLTKNSITLIIAYDQVVEGFSTDLIALSTSSLLVHINYTLSFYCRIVLLEIELLELLKDFDYFHKCFSDWDRYIIPVAR